jgi:hypothetical protein
MVLYAYGFVYAFLLRRESPGRILGDKPLLFQGGSVTVASVTPLVMARYSVLTLERETTVCHLADQVVPEEHGIA